VFAVLFAIPDAKRLDGKIENTFGIRIKLGLHRSSPKLRGLFTR
jgi:hypothetical protein